MQRMMLILAAAAVLCGPVPARAELISVSAFGSVYHINATTGAATLLGATQPTFGLAYDDAAGVLYGHDSSNIFTIDLATYAATNRPGYGAAVPAGLIEGGLAIDPTDGQMYMVQDATIPRRFWSVNKTTGVATSIAFAGTGDRSGLEFLPDGTLLVLDTGSDTLQSVNKATGVGTVIGPLGANFGTVGGLAYQDGFLYAVESNLAPATISDLWRIDPATGAATFIGSTGVAALTGLESLGSDAVVIAPEPSTLLLGSLLLGLGLLLYRRRYSSAASR